jgi:hypothetical protein
MGGDGDYGYHSLLGRIVFKLAEVGVGLGGKNEFGHGRLFGLLGEGPPFAGPFLSETGQDF